jgi:transposase
LFTRNGKGLTARGIKPICDFHQVFESLYLFGAFSPINGDHFELEMPHCSADTFQIYLNEFSKRNFDEFIILLLDNGAFHKARKLIIPENIVLLFIPAYSPELNPAEKIWWKMKRSFTGKLHHTLDNVSNFIKEQVTILTDNNVLSICKYDFIFSCPIWTYSY